MRFEVRLFALVFFGGLFGCSPNTEAPADDASSDTAPEAATAQAGAAETETPPNILFIVADDIGFTDLGAFGGEISTPNLDRLAHAGLRLNNLHAAQACRPTRLMLMSGAGTEAANQPYEGASRGSVLTLNFAIIPELLQDAGYATYGAGKWDLGNVDGYTPADRGFDRSWMQLGGSSSYFAEYLTGDVLGFEDDGRTVELAELPDDFYVTEHYTDKMLEYLQSTEEGTPWFAYMPYTAPHWPLMLPDDWLDRYAGRYDDGYDALRARRFEQASEAGVLPPGSNLDDYQSRAEPWSNLSKDEQRRYSRAQEIYAGMVEYLDMSVGRVIDYLEESGQLDNTIIVFTADHGASSSEHGVDTGRGSQRVGTTIPDRIDNSLENFGRPGSFIDHGRGFGEAATAPFKHQKGSLDEGALRAAAFVHYPAAVEAGDVSNAFMTMMDFLPTFLEIAGTEHPGAGPYRDDREINDIVGRSAWPHLTAQSSTIHSPTDSAGWVSGDGGALIRGNYKIINRPPPGAMGSTPWRLYDLTADPGERRDIAAENAALTAELAAEWAENWR